MSLPRCCAQLSSSSPLERAGVEREENPGKTTSSMSFEDSPCFPPRSRPTPATTQERLGTAASARTEPVNGVYIRQSCCRSAESTGCPGSPGSFALTDLASGTQRLPALQSTPQSTMGSAPASVASTPGRAEHPLQGHRLLRRRPGRGGTCQPERNRIESQPRSTRERKRRLILLLYIVWCLSLLTSTLCANTSFRF